MTAPSHSRSDSSRDRTYISRDEFTVFERNVDRSFGSVTEAINALTVKIDRMGSTDWKTFGMFAGLILSIVALAASPFLRDLGRLEDHQNQLREKIEAGSGDHWTEDDERERQRDELAEFRRIEAMLNHHTEDGHPRIVLDRLEDLAGEVERLRREIDNLQKRPQ